LQSFLDLPNILFKEETEQYRKQLENKNLSDLSKFHNDSGKILAFVNFLVLIFFNVVYNSSMYHIMSVIDAPTIETLDMRNQIMEHQIEVVESRQRDLSQKKNSFIKVEAGASPSTSD
jgi:BRCC36 C-terminal helical domain